MRERRHDDHSIECPDGLHVGRGEHVSHVRRVETPAEKGDEPAVHG
jgi:hypothetical protein